MLLVRYLQQPSAVCVFIQEDKGSIQKFIEALGEIKHERLEHGIVLLEPASIQMLPGYDKGWFSVLSATNQQLRQILPELKPKTILDACAAPGGKSLLLRSKYGQSVQLTATDVDTDNTFVTSKLDP